MTSEQVANLLLAGITLGAVYSIMALGLTFIYSVTKIFNYAQGAFFTWAGYIAWVFSGGYVQLNYIVAIIITIAIMFLFGIGFEKALMYPIRRFRDWDFTAIIVTLGAALLLDNLALVIFTNRPRAIPYLVEGSYYFGAFSITKHSVVTLIASIIILVLITIFLSKNRQGMSMEGLGQDSMGAKIVGIPINKMFGYAFGISAVLAAISAILLGPKILIYPSVGWVVFIKAFICMTFGGLGSIKGAVIAAFILSMLEVFVTWHLGGIWGTPVFIIVLIIVLIVRPKGLFGKW